MSSASLKQGPTKRINQTIWTKSEFYSIFLSFIVRILHSDIRSGSSFRAPFPSADVGKEICRRSRMSSASLKQGPTKRINQTIWTKSEFYSIFLSFIVRILHSDIRSGSSFRAPFPSADVGKEICRVLAHFQMLPSFARHDPVWVIGMISVAQNSV